MTGGGVRFPPPLQPQLHAEYPRQNSGAKLHLGSHRTVLSALHRSSGVQVKTLTSSEDSVAISPRIFRSVPALPPPSVKFNLLSSPDLGNPSQIMAASGRS